ncbi:hypothetical protein [Desulfosporosinus sp. BICA1-9]|uniref:hypothetical protein n=1 Tax=Desulfosporosinus sp. BICA1-9 TaxID=1531958 RepID=UPI00054C4ACE|nr:hypothetical protein [Desulfosporosinus sp. BICA1-9]KJS50270.1 MAG: hypothetical protein VR66_03670 [Peptococcaceae bacterium BRH_c23]KJS85105.1 MAG: hypothetical protein JL57_19870 [Desulfosporosinus sp. BICA1-9]HBW34073.1 hypothetical protein [Desulfosporosinus sp.]
MIEAKKKFFFRNEGLFEVGDRVETCNHCTGIVVRVDRDEMGVFIVVRLDVMLGEFAYNPRELEKLQ